MDNDNITKLLQKKELELLQSAADVLRKNNIEFFLACGTSLGCARHSGFIPWDDDVDLYVRGRDYEKVRRVLSNAHESGLLFHDYSTVPDYPYPFPKIVAKDTVLIEESLKHLEYKSGVYIDIFPLMETSNDLKKRHKSEKKRYWYYCLLKAYYFKLNGWKRVLNVAAHLFIKPNLVQNKLKIEYERKIDNSEILIDTGTFGAQALLKANDFKTCKSMIFEGLNMPMPVNYDSYLKNYYGDYMQLPSVEQRVSNHHIHSLIIGNDRLL